MRRKTRSGKTMREEFIRPRKIFSQFLAITKSDISRYFRKVTKRRIKCPACLNSQTRFVFKKEGFAFESCTKCKTLFVNPRATIDSFYSFYERGRSVKFLADVAFKKTLRARQHWVNKPRIELVNELISTYYRQRSNITLVDIGAGNGMFCKDVIESCPKKLRVIAVEPSPPAQQNCHNNGLLVINKPFEAVTEKDLPRDGRRIFTCFELMEHLPDPNTFFAACRKLLSKNDLFVFTTLNGLGFDIQLLWDKHRCVCPPHHLNFFNPGAVRILLRRHRFKVIKLYTPGRLDVDIVQNDIQKLLGQRFWRHFFSNLDLEGCQEFQHLLQKYSLSSHMVTVASRC